MATPRKPRDQWGPVGRPTKYRKNMPDRVRKLGASTVTNTSLELGVTVETVYDWMKTYPDFSEAVKMAKAKVAHEYEKIITKQAKGKITGGNAAAPIFMLKNLAPTEYMDQRHLVHTGEVKQTLDINYLGATEHFQDDPIDGEFEEITFDD